MLFTLVFSVHWIIVFAGLLTWRPKDLRDEEAGIEMTTHIVDDSSLEVQDRNGDVATLSTGSEGNHNANVIRTTSSNCSTESLVEDHPVLSTSGSPPK